MEEGQDSEASQQKRRTSAAAVRWDVSAMILHLSTVGQEPWEHGGCRPRNTLALIRKVGTQKASAPRSKFEAVIPSVDHTKLLLGGKRKKQQLLIDRLLCQYQNKESIHSVFDQCQHFPF